MRCKCGNEIRNVPEHLRDLVEWLCEKCMSASPRRTMRVEHINVEDRREPTRDEDEEQAA
ncbi:MAG: hypothetical protein QHI38_06095 [Armatimonadota bacterium]|nr:hypothetical protein [Armatimonadota bacterium]